MVSPIYVLFLIFCHIIKNVNSQDSPGNILGPMACDCFGMNNHYCEIPDIPIESLPKNCSSYLYMFITVENNTLIDQGEEYGTIPGHLDQLIQTNIPVLVYYYHAIQMEWCAAVQCDTAGQTAEMENLKSYLDKHPGIKGIILRGLLDLLEDVTSADCPDYTQNLLKYIELMRKTFPNLSIGVVISSKRARDWYNNSELAWLDYSVLEPRVDFFVVSFLFLNECSDEYLKTGVLPLCGNSNNTVDAMKTFLDNAGVPSTKVYYTFDTFGYSKDINRTCDAYPVNSCTNVPDVKTSICMDTLQTLYDKGAYAKTNGAGLVVNTIDLDDTDSSCKCGQSFPAFYALLNGFKGGPPPAPCALYDRT